MCTLSEPPPRAVAPAPPTAQDNEWLQGVPAVNLPGSRLPRSGSTRKAKAKRRAKSGGLNGHRRTPGSGSLCGTLSGVSGGEVVGDTDGGGGGVGVDGLRSGAQQPQGAPACSAELFTGRAAAAAEATGAIPAAHGATTRALSELSSTSVGSMSGIGAQFVSLLVHTAASFAGFAAHQRAVACGAITALATRGSARAHAMHGAQSRLQLVWVTSGLQRY